MKNAPVYKASLRHITRCVFFIVIFAPVIVSAQVRGKVEVVKDPRIDTLASRRANLKNDHSAVTYAHTSTFSARVDGYRVQIFSGSNRKDAYDTQAKFMNTYPGTRTYIIYSEPNFKVRAGDFRTRLEAEKLMQELRRSFTSLFIIEEKINLPKTDTPND
jgi:hypothetical protein